MAWIVCVASSVCVDNYIALFFPLVGKEKELEQTRKPTGKSQ